MQTIKKLATLASTIGFGLVLSGNAVAQEKQFTYTKNYGVWKAKGTFHAHAKVTNRSEPEYQYYFRFPRFQSVLVGTQVRRQAYGHAKNDIELFGKRTEAARIDVSATTIEGKVRRTSTGRASLKLFGKTVWTKNGAGEIPLFRWAVGSPNLAGGSVKLGPVRVSIRAGATAGVELGVNLSAVLGVAPQAGIGGFGRGFAHGEARASLGGRGLSAGVSTILNFANIKAAYDLLVQGRNLHGAFTLDVKPIELMLKVWARMKIKVWRWKKTISKSKTLFSWRLGAFNRTYQLH